MNRSINFKIVESVRRKGSKNKYMYCHVILPECVNVFSKYTSRTVSTLGREWIGTGDMQFDVVKERTYLKIGTCSTFLLVQIDSVTLTASQSRASSAVLLSCPRKPCFVVRTHYAARTSLCARRSSTLICPNPKSRQGTT